MFQSKKKFKRQANGFSLIELMVVVAILAIITTMAAPSMTTIIKNNRLQSMNADFIALLKYARAEAKNQGQAVVVATANNSNTWHDNTVVAFIDLDADSVFDATDTELRRVDVSEHFTMTSLNLPSTTIASLTFLSSGFTSGNLTYRFTLCDDRSGHETYQYDILSSGLSYSGAYTCP